MLVKRLYLRGSRDPVINLYEISWLNRARSLLIFCYDCNYLLLWLSSSKRGIANLIVRHEILSWASDSDWYIYIIYIVIMHFVLLHDDMHKLHSRRTFILLQKSYPEHTWSYMLSEYTVDAWIKYPFLLVSLNTFSQTVDCHLIK